MDFPDPSSITDSIRDGTFSAPGNVMLLGIATSGPVTCKRNMFIYIVVSQWRKKKGKKKKHGRRKTFTYTHQQLLHTVGGHTVKVGQV